MTSLGPIQHLALRLGILSVGVKSEILLIFIDCEDAMLIVFPD